MEKSYDLVALGTGTAAATATSLCRARGWTVAIVDSRPFGGTCALRGCDPKKVLVGAAELIDWNRRMKGKGVEADQARINWADLMRFKRSFTGPIPKSREEGFAKAGIEGFHGRARFIGPQAVQVGEDILRGRYIVVATGAQPMRLNIPGEERVVTSDRFLELDMLPPSIVFIGGGYISFEFAHLAARAGARVTILHRGPRPLELFDPQLVDQLTGKTRRLGIDVQLETQAEAIEETAGGFLVRVSTSKGRGVFQADLVVHGAGRVPELEDLNLSAAGVEFTKRGVKVNEFFQSVSNSAVYAAGDAAATEGFPLTPVAGYEGRIAAENLLDGNHRRADYLGVPSVVFTIPPLASAGLQESQARQRGLDFRVNYQKASNWYSSRRVGEDESGSKVLVENGSDLILGAHLLGLQAEEVINLFALAIRTRMRAAEFKDMVFAYPTHSSDIAYMV